MRLNYKFSNLCGVVYKQGNIEYTADGTGLFSAVGRRVTYFDLVNNTSVTFPFELPQNVQRLAISPNGALLVAVDGMGHGIILAVPYRVVLHHINFHEPVRVLSFSPDGERLVVVSGSRVRVWRTPSGVREFAPLALDRTLGGGHTDDIVSVDWSMDSRYLLTASHDMTARVYDLRRDELNPSFIPLELRSHRHPLEAAYFAHNDERIITVGRNGSLFVWSFDSANGRLLENYPTSRARLTINSQEDDKDTLDQGQVQSPEKTMDGLTRRSKVTTTAFNKRHNLLVAAFTNGLFGIYTVTPFESIYTLSLTQASISAMAINETGEWLALGVADHGQLLVWEWRSESFVLKQQGHAVPMNSLAYAPDGQTLATGSADGRVKLWNATSGLCHVTFSEHTAAVTAIEFSKGGKVVVSASCDGTVRAYDLLRYRNFRTLTTPRPVQFQSLAVDPSGELIAAGTLDTFEIFLWSLQTGQLLEVLAGHTGPISSLAFDPVGHRLASGSWDRTIRLWDVFQRNKNVEQLDHGSDVLAIAFRPDGHHIAAATLSGELFIWDVELGTLLASINTRRDYADRPLSPATLRSLAYSPDGSVLLTAGSFPFVAFYDVASHTLLRRFPVARIRRDKPEATAEVAVAAVRIASTNRAFAALTGEGLVLFSLDDALAFDPFDLELDLTPQHIQQVLREEKHYLKAFVMALRLNIPNILDQVWTAIPSEAIALLVRNLPVKYILSTLTLLARLATNPIRLELLLRWVISLLSEHALILRQHRTRYAASLRLLLKNTHSLYTDLAKVSNQTMFILDVLCDRHHN